MAMVALPTSQVAVASQVVAVSQAVVVDHPEVFLAAQVVDLGLRVQEEADRGINAGGYHHQHGRRTTESPFASTSGFLMGGSESLACRHRNGE